MSDCQTVFDRLPNTIARKLGIGVCVAAQKKLRSARKRWGVSYFAQISGRTKA
jgi:hypothetical protein